MPKGVYKHYPYQAKSFGKKRGHPIKGKKYPKMKKQFTKEHIEKLKESHKGMLGKHHSEETKRKISLSHKGQGILWLKKYQFKSGKQHPKWKGGVCRDKHYLGKKEYREWRIKIFKRDDFTCCICHKTGGYLEAHHIKSWAKYPKLRFIIENGITLCKECHKLTNNYGGRHYESNKISGL